MEDEVEDAYERFLHARSQLADLDMQLRTSRLTLSRTFPGYSATDLQIVNDALERYASAAGRLTRASEMLTRAVAARLQPHGAE